jgi:hypothetical protein
MRKLLLVILAFLVSSPERASSDKLVTQKLTFRDISTSGIGAQGTTGPRPRVDVTAYGAKGDGVTDDTAAIQAAIKAACVNGPTGFGSVFFPPPPGNAYLVSQPQTPSTAPVFTVCSGLHVVGGNGLKGGAQFIYSPAIVISVIQHLGTRPNDSAVFGLTFGNNGVTFENITIVGYNQAFSLNGVTGTMFKNVTGSIQNTGRAHNNFYYVTGSLGIHWEDSAGQVAATQYIWGFDDTNGSQPDGLFFIDGGTFVGCPIQYTNNANQTASGPGSWYIRNLWGESCNSDLISITNPSGRAFPSIGPININNLQVADSGCATCAMINLNSAGTTLTYVTISGGSRVGNRGLGTAIRVTAGAARDWHVDGGDIGQPIDVNGNPIASGTGTNTNGGRDFVANTSDASRLSSWWGLLHANGPMARFFAGGNPIAGLALDPTGVFFNDAANPGYNVALQQTSRGTLDISFAQALSPTDVVGTPATGGSLRPNTYFAWVSTTWNNCTNISALSLPSDGIVVRGAYNAITVSWTLPPAAVLTPAGYCISLSTSTLNLPVGGLFVAGGSTTTATIKTIPGGQQQISYNALKPVHRFTSTSLGVNTANPQFNLDVTGTGRFTGAVTIGGGAATNKILMASRTLTYTAIAAQTCQEKTLTLTGSATTGIAMASPAASLGSTNLSWSAWVSATNIVSVRVCNPSTASITPSGVTWNVRVAQ